MNQTDARAKWREANYQGNGYVYPFGTTVKEALDGYAAGGGRVKYYPRTTSEIGLVRWRGETLGIGDANGPWVCVLEQSGADWVGLGTGAGEMERACGIRDAGKSWYDHIEAKRLSDAALGSDCQEYGFDRSALDLDDVDAYTSALNGESIE